MLKVKNKTQAYTLLGVVGFVTVCLTAVDFNQVLISGVITSIEFDALTEFAVMYLGKIIPFTVVFLMSMVGFAIEKLDG